jgi:Tol biopolymer transport system component
VGNLLALTLSTPSPHTEDLNVLIATRSGEITFPSTSAAEPTSWAPDSERLAAYEYDPTNSPTGPAVLDFRTGRRYEIGLFSSSELAWSPRGDLVAYGHDGYVFVEHPNATKRHRLTRGAFMDWSGDGTLLAFVRRRGKAWSGGYVMRPNGRNVRHMPGRPTDWAWSPRGRTYAFGRELYDFATRRRWRILPRSVEVSKPIWSPDGRRLAYPGVDKLFVVDRSGRHGHVIRWPDAVRASGPSWSPDGRTLAFTTEDGLYLVGADGRHPRYVPLRLCD